MTAMIKLTINSIEAEVSEGVTVLDAAAAAGIVIPAMCNNGAVEHFASCMVCVVKNKANGSFLPSCSTTVQEGMDILTEDADITEARRTTLELLLSEHVGDCEAPCRIACPAFMDIPQMNRLIAEGKTAEAYALVKEDIALPGVLGLICPAPCEGACRRRPIDQAVSICLLKGFTAIETIAEKVPIITFPQKVCIIGSGPAGLSAAYFLQKRGIQTSLYDQNALPGGALRYVIEDAVYDKSVLDREIEIIRQMGAVFLQNQTIDANRFQALCSEFDAVVLATGTYSDAFKDWGLAHDDKHILVEKGTYCTSNKKVFAIGNTTRSSKLAIRSAAQGKEVALVLEQLFKGEPVTGEKRHFNSSFGKLIAEEYTEYLKESIDSKRQQPASRTGFSPEEARTEALRCMHCDCRKASNCLLRDLSDHFKASQKRFMHTQRLAVVKNIAFDQIVYEPGKCIKCGICVRMTAKYQETFGFTYIGRGFDVQIGIPFDEKMEAALCNTMDLVAEACPTGALSSMKKKT